jgi:hypothetical protein
MGFLSVLLDVRGNQEMCVSGNADRWIAKPEIRVTDSVFIQSFCVIGQKILNGGRACLGHTDV